MGCERSKTDRMLRFSSGWETKEEDWKLLLEGIKTAYARLSRFPNTDS
jgi:cysteine sulfinate desulfinase/cysteine desulfurase-like protein